MKSPRRRLTQTADLMALAEITARELVACTVYGHGIGPGAITVQLKPPALVRVFQLLRVSRRKVDVSQDGDGGLHVRFSARGAEWCAYVLADSPEGRQWRAALASARPPAIAAPPALALPPPDR